MKKWLIIFIFSGILISFFIYQTIEEREISIEQNTNLNTAINIESIVIENINIQTPLPLIYEPVDEFKERITKKPFGIFITPATSPVQPEKFSGYHTGVDVEYEDVTEDVEVRSITDGKVVDSRFVSGYGGVLVIEQEINGEKILALYGHLDLKSMPAINTGVLGGKKIAILGDGYTAETDGERKHLHFGIIKGTTISYKGYVNNQAQLEAWIDPLNYY